ncbi:methylmalonyl-CoA carboxyltransferase [Marinicauda salina]|uniref:Methylmalonyl-CoA carboxyltransferase n=1 Tax=Marinicauda salina TaxID=2135793 RepID=A0A2U2BRL9_9PROT|nr:methylmalonyl-CoA carboxyltransferase [Marinicauda salina]
MSWKDEIEELRKRRELARGMGGPEKLARQRAAGRLNVRERIDQLLDAGSFREVGSIAGSAEYDAAGALTDFKPANCVFGRGEINGRTVAVVADDFTVRGGAADAAIIEKQIQAEKMAGELRLPLIRLIEGTGGGGSVKSLLDMGASYIPFNPGWDQVVANLERVPVVSLVLGPVAGLGAARAVSSHYSVMVKGLSQMFVAGPPVVAGIGETVTKEELGGADIQLAAGAVDDAYATEAEAMEAAKWFLSHLPDSIHEPPARGPVSDDPARTDPRLSEIVPRDRRYGYDMHAILRSTMDAGSVFEMGRNFGRSVITALARLDGWPVAVLASNPNIYGGGWTAEAAQKVTRFVDLAETFRLPVVHFVDIPGFVIGTQAERAGTIRHGARALSAIYQATTPWCAIVVRKAFGVAGAAMMDHTRFRWRYAWPSGYWGSLPLEGGLEAAFKAALAESEDPDAMKAELNRKMSAVTSPFRTAERFWAEEIIDPADTRPLLTEFARLAAPLREPRAQPPRYRP